MLTATAHIAAACQKNAEQVEHESRTHFSTALLFAPVAVQGKALVASSAMCVALGALAVGAWKLAGLQYKEIVQVSSWQDAVALAQQQRVSIRACAFIYCQITSC